MSNTKTLLLLALLLTIAGTATAQVDAGHNAIRQAALDYIEGWYAGDATRMERALHPDLVKRIVETEDGRSALREMTASQLVTATGAGGGRQTPADRRRTEVTVLDVFGNTASVRVDAHEWVDHMQLARFDGEWKIINVLWERRP
jgi:hypothetical protein